MADQDNSDWIVSELRRAAVSERAPGRLREEIDAISRRRSRRPQVRPRRLMLVPGGALVAAVVVVLVLVLPGGAGRPSVAQAAALSARADGVAPGGGSPSYPAFADVRFPTALVGQGAWRYRSERVQSLDGQKLLTIVYARGAQRVVYSVAAAPLLSGQRSGFSSFGQSGRTVISWQESGHSCLLSSATLSRAALLQLAES